MARVIFSRHTVRLIEYTTAWVERADDIDHVDLRALYQYWADKRGDRRFPSRREMDVLEMQPWLGHLVLLDILDGGRDFHVRIHGTVAASRVGEDLTKRALSTSSHPAARRAMEEYRQVAEQGRVLFSKSRILRDGRPEAVRKLTLPLADAGEVADRIIAGIYGGAQLALAEPPVEG